MPSEDLTLPCPHPLSLLLQVPFPSSSLLSVFSSRVGDASYSFMHTKHGPTTEVSLKHCFVLQKEARDKISQTVNSIKRIPIIDCIDSLICGQNKIFSHMWKVCYMVGLNVLIIVEARFSAGYWLSLPYYFYFFSC